MGQMFIEYHLFRSPDPVGCRM